MQSCCASVDLPGWSGHKIYSALIGLYPCTTLRDIIRVGYCNLGKGDIGIGIRKKEGKKGTKKNRNIEKEKRGKERERERKDIRSFCHPARTAHVKNCRIGTRRISGSRYGQIQPFNKQKRRGSD